MAINGLGVVSGSYATTGFVEDAVGLAPSPPTSIANSGGTATLTGNTVTFSGVSSVSLNGCFTGDYDNYRVLVDFSVSTANIVYWRLRNAGSDISTSTYDSASLAIYSNTSGAVTATTDKISVGNMSGQCGVTMDVLRPFTTVPTRVLLLSGRQTEANFYSVIQSDSASRDGLSLIATSGNMTGAVSVYGYRK